MTEAELGLEYAKYVDYFNAHFGNAYGPKMAADLGESVDTIKQNITLLVQNHLFEFTNHMEYGDTYTLKDMGKLITINFIELTDEYTKWYNAKLKKYGPSDQDYEGPDIRPPMSTPVQAFTPSPVNRNKLGIFKKRALATFELVAGIILTALGALCSLALFCSNAIPDAIVFLIFVVLGVVFILIGKRTNAIISLYKRYVAILSENDSNSIELIATTVGKSVDAVKLDINAMIKMGLFVHASVDNTTNTIVLGSRNASVSTNGNSIDMNITITNFESNMSVPTMTQEPEYVAVKCDGCGATSKVEKGKVIECQYCGNPLSGN